MKTNLKIGDLIYLKDVGYPFNRTDDGGESWEGASCIVKDIGVGVRGDLIEVEPLIPIRINSRSNETMKTCVFDPSKIIKEDRTWLIKHFNSVLEMKKNFLRLANTIYAELNN